MGIDTTREQVIRVSLRWVILGVLLVALAGFLGGVFAQYAFPLRQSLPIQDGQIVTTVQEVTISPSRVAADLAQRWRRSVFLVGPVSDQFPPTALATGLLVTSDGVLVIAGQLPAIPLQAHDWQGQPVPLERLGYDALYDLSYYRLSSGVFSPVDFDQEDPAVAHQLLLLSNSPETFTPTVVGAMVESYALPGERPAGVTRLVKINTALPSTGRGVPALTDEGRVAGILRDPEARSVIPISLLKQSLTRLTSNRLEENPLQPAGFNVTYTYVSLPTASSAQFAAKVSEVAPTGRAFTAGLRVGDLIVAVKGNPLIWTDNFVDFFASTQPVALKVLRQGEQIDLSL